MNRIAVGLMCAGLLLGARAVAAQQDESLAHEAFRKLHEAGQFNGAVLIAKDGAILLDGFFGEADKLESTPLAANSLYRLASVSKTITSSALLALVDAGELSLDDPVQQHLASFPFPEITLRHLLQHSSGLPESIFGVGAYWDASKGAMTNRDVLQWLIDTQPSVAFPAGESWDYCNTGYALIPLIIESATELSYPEHVRRAVFDEAGMSDSFHISELGPEELPRVAQGHGFDYGAGADVRVDKHPFLSGEFRADGVWGAGDIFSTTQDLLAFDRALKAGKVVSLPLQVEAYTSLMLPEGFPANYGLGWQVAESDYTGRILHHHGQGDGYRTRYYRFLDRDITIVLLQNAREEYADDALLVAQQLAFQGTYSLPKPSLAEALSRTMHREGLEATTQLVDRVSATPQEWSLDERDLNNFALTFWFRGEQETAVTLMMSYLALMPDNPNVYATVAQALGDVGRAEESQAHYAKALEVAKRDPQRYAGEIARLQELVGG